VKREKNKIEINSLDNCKFCIKKECDLKEFILNRRKFLEVIVIQCSSIEVKSGNK